MDLDKGHGSVVYACPAKVISFKLSYSWDMFLRQVYIPAFQRFPVQSADFRVRHFPQAVNDLLVERSLRK